MSRTTSQCFWGALLLLTVFNCVALAQTNNVPPTDRRLERAYRVLHFSDLYPPEAVQYINYHGTGTELNDRIETRAVKLAFDGHAYKLAGSSLKSLIGHPQGACGAAGVACILLAMRDGVAPPTVNVAEPDPNCDLDYIPDAGRRLDIEYAVANCIAFGSKNSALLLRRI